MKLYVIGKVTGVPRDNRPKFEKARACLMYAGFEVEIPHDSIPEGTPWKDAMRLSIANLLASDGVAMLDDLYWSRGARIERAIAKMLEIPVLPVSCWLTKKILGEVI